MEENNRAKTTAQKISVVKGYFNNVEEIQIYNYLCKFA